MILVFGNNGQVGQELQRSLALSGETRFLGREACDLTDFASIKAHIEVHRPRVIIKASAYTAVDKAESEPDLCHAVNAQAAGVMAAEAQKLKAHFIYYSTDYVYDGKKTGIYNEKDAHNPLNIYGKSKSEGEKLIAQACDSYTILRTSWVYSLFGSCFPKAILKKALISDRLDVVADQVGSPTSASLIADVTALVVREKLMGNYNLVSNGYTSWYDYAKLLVDEYGGLKTQTFPSQTVQAVGKAMRPENSRLSVSKLEAALNITLPPWEDDVRRFVRDYKRISI
jgi:dTDP-4-dehydrorhamnose reductase